MGVLILIITVATGMIIKNYKEDSTRTLILTFSSWKLG